MRKKLIGTTAVIAAGGLAALTLGGAPTTLRQAEAAAPSGWVGSWGASMSRGDQTHAQSRARHGFGGNVTLRQDVRLSAGGQRARIRLSNQFGDRTIAFGSVTIARANSAGEPIASTTRNLTFGGARSVNVAKGKTRGSDPVNFTAPSHSQVVVSYYLPRATGPTTFHHVTKERASFGSGDQTHSSKRLAENDETYFLNQVDMHRNESNVGTVVVLGDSITDGVFKKPGEHYSFDSQMPYPSWLGNRILNNGHGRIRGTVNAGLAGGELLANDQSLPSGNARLYTDVFYRPNVKTMVVLLGTNDIINKANKGTSGADIYHGMKSLVAKAHARGINVIGSTIPPTGAGPSSPVGRRREHVRTSFNALVRQRSPFDCRVDFEGLLADPSRPNKIVAKYDSGDHLHPNAAGYKAMGDAIPASCVH